VPLRWSASLSHTCAIAVRRRATSPQQREGVSQWY
jgi:hypothetical protein